ncbi:MAG: DUF3363 domain-containing protein [Rhizobiales bacterium]|nr:DUF3363 domain-containing protein [Hyphomicrobiales bacterium]
MRRKKASVCLTSIPWRPVIDRQLSKYISGIVQGGSLSWQLGKHRELRLWVA